MYFQKVDGVYAFVEHLFLLMLLFLRWFAIRSCLFLFWSLPFLWAEIAWIRWIYALTWFHHLREVMPALLVTAAVDCWKHLGLVRGRLVVWDVLVLWGRLMWNAEWTLFRLSVIPPVIESRYRFHLCRKMLMRSQWNLRASSVSTPLVIIIEGGLTAH